MRCPDCHNFHVLGDGDGKCSVCYGTGQNQNVQSQLGDSLSGTETDCWKCSGSGECQTCGGSGTVDGDD